MPAENHAHKHKLKNCPLCGSADLTLDNLGQRNDWFVNCNICEVQLIANYTEAQAVALWNRRPVTEASRALKTLYAAYVRLLESGRDRILSLGGTCDLVETMEAGDPALCVARVAIAETEA